MVQVNLIGKKRKERSKKNWIMITLTTLFGAFALYFLGATIYMVVKLFTLNREIKAVDDEAVQVSGIISSNKEALSRFVLSKHILDRMDGLKNTRFRYKDYLDQLSKLMPPAAVLTNVDFATKGWIAVSVTLSGTNSLKVFEDNFAEPGRLAQTEFASVFSESVTSDKSGLYNVKLHFEIKDNGRK